MRNSEEAKLKKRRTALKGVISRRSDRILELSNERWFAEMELRNVEAKLKEYRRPATPPQEQDGRKA